MGVITVGITGAPVSPVVLAGVGLMAKGRGRETWSTGFRYSVDSRN
jgi:hypothetical protein